MPDESQVTEVKFQTLLAPSAQALSALQNALLLLILGFAFRISGTS